MLIDEQPQSSAVLMGKPVYLIEAGVPLTQEQSNQIVQDINDYLANTELNRIKLLLLPPELKIRPLSPDAELIPKAADIFEKSGLTDLANWLREAIE